MNLTVCKINKKIFKRGKIPQPLMPLSFPAQRQSQCNNGGNLVTEASLSGRHFWK